MRMVYICSPLHGNMKENIEKANQYCAAAAHMGVVPLAPHTIFTKYLNDDIPQQRERGLTMGLELLSRSDELWVCGNMISPGMRGEIEYAKRHGIPTKYMKEVLNLNVKPDLKKLHTRKSMILQQYQPIYTAYYNVTVDKNLGNFAKVCFDTGKTIMVDGAQHALDFLKMESGEWKKAVEPILAPLIAADQNQLFQQLELNQYNAVYPKKDLQLPYLLLQECQSDLFAYCPIAKEDKFSVLIRGLDGQVLRDSNNNLFGVYSNQIANMEHIERFHIPGLLNSLKEIEPIAVQEYQEHVVLQKLEKVFQETGARMFVFPGKDSNTPALVSFPAEANDYLTPEELKLAEEVILRQENDDVQPTQETPELEEEQMEYSEEEDMGPELSM